LFQRALSAKSVGKQLAASVNGFGQQPLHCEMMPCASFPSEGQEMMKKNTITAAEFDRKADDGEDLSEYLDWSKAYRPNAEPKRVNVDFPQWMVNGLDREATRLGVTRQSLIKMWIAEKLDPRPHST
jgi:CopG antitoxin of type II toxin-antitoxin system